MYHLLDIILHQKPPLGDHQPEVEGRREEGGEEVLNIKNPLYRTLNLTETEEVPL